MISTKTLAARLAGGDDYIRTNNGRVRGLALRTDLNPEAPKVIVVGTGPRIKKKAELLSRTRQAVPVYVKVKTNAWDYRGEFVPVDYRADGATIEKHRGNRQRSKVSGILFLNPIDNLAFAGGGFPDPVTRKEIESAAIKFVWDQLESDKFKVHDHQKENRGYDLLAVSPHEELKVEVKGADGLAQRFFITRNERACAIDPSWRLAIVTNARTNPQMELMSGREMEKRFEFGALAWECVPPPVSAAET